PGTTPDRLPGGSLIAAGRMEIHEMATVDGVMKMRPLAAGLEIKPGETVELKPGSFHMMFMELKAPLTAGQPVKGTLVFEKAGTIEIEYAVAPIGAAAPFGGHGGPKGHGSARRGFPAARRRRPPPPAVPSVAFRKNQPCL